MRLTEDSEGTCCWGSAEMLWGNLLRGLEGRGWHWGTGSRNGGGEQAAFLPSIPNAGMTVGNGFKATTMEIKGMRM